MSYFVLQLKLAILLFVISVSPASAGQTQRYCFIDELCFEDRSDLLFLPDIEGEKEKYRGQTWSISWGYANENDWPDLYLNHHTRRSTAGRFPDSHLVLDVGAGEASVGYRTLSGQDQHSAIFLNIDGKGNDDLLEAIGGRRGTASPANQNIWTRYFPNATGAENPETLSWELGLHEPGSRGRTFVPLKFRDNLALFSINARRDDNRYASSLLVQNASGAFEEVSRITAKGANCSRLTTCTEKLIFPSEYSWFTWGAPGGGNGFQMVFGGSQKDETSLIAAQVEEGEVVAVTPAITPSLLLPSSILDGGFVDLDNDGKEELVVVGRRDVHILNDTFNPSGETIWSKFANFFDDMFRWPGKTNHSKFPAKGVIWGDFNNSGFVDLISIHQSDNEFGLIFWENRGELKFEKHYLLDFKQVGRIRNISKADFDLDGDLDIIFSDGKGTPEYARDPQTGGTYHLLENTSKGNWIQVKLEDQLGLHGLGAKVFLESETTEQFRVQKLGVHGEVQDHSLIHFGLASDSKADIRVVWPNGHETLINNVQANTRLRITTDGVTSFYSADLLPQPL